MPIHYAILPETLVKLHQELADTQTTESAWKIVAEYFRFFGLEDVQHELWVITACTLTNNETQQFQKPTDRQNLIFFFEYTKMFFEAVHFLLNKCKEGKAETK
jgi:hypothetical protein